MPHGLAYVLPVGISFFTFQSMSYTIDFYLGKVPRERNLLALRRSSASSRSSWPGRSSGPARCCRSSSTRRHFALNNLTDGLSLFLVGLFKKAGAGQLPGDLRRSCLRQPAGVRCHDR